MDELLSLIGSKASEWRIKKLTYEKNLKDERIRIELWDGLTFSVICNKYSYGGEDGLNEIWGWFDYNDEPLWKEPIGWLTDADAFEEINKKIKEVVPC